MISFFHPAQNAYAKMVQKSHPHFKQKISPHTLRHTKGMYLLQGGVFLDVIRDFLGHVDIKTTEIYARANLEMKRAAPEKISTAPTPKIPSWKKKKHYCSGCNLYDLMGR